MAIIRGSIPVVTLLCLVPAFLPAQIKAAPTQPGSEPIWEQDLRGTVIGLPTLQAESAVVVLEEGEIKSYSRFGNWLWTYHANEKLVAHVSRSREGTTYACTARGTVIAINRVGRELWKLELGSPITSPVIVGWDGRLFIPIGSKVYCRTASGYSLWVIDLGSPIFVKPILDHRGGLAMVLDNNDFVLLSHLGIIERFRLNSKPLHIVPLELSRGKDSFFLLSASGAVDKMYRDADNKLARESLPALSQTPAAAVSWKEKVAVTLRDGRVQLLSSSTGEVLWTANSHETAAERGAGSLEPYWAAMQFDERGVYTLSTKGATGFRESDGARWWILHITGAAAVPSFSDEGYLYSGGSDRILHTYWIEERKRNVPRSMYGPAPEGSYKLGNPPPSSWARIGDGRFDPVIVRVMHDEIEAAIKAGQVGQNEPDYVAYLMEMAGISLAPDYSPVRPQLQIGERIECIRLLGYLGSRETIPFLARLFSVDREPIVRSACCESIGRIGVDPTGAAIRAFTYLLAPDNAAMDPSVLMAAATATKDLCRFSGPPLSDAGIRLLRAFTATDFPVPVKRHATKELESLFK
ncbi:MAG: PQQ-binding-like beta-propeller repeat protein [Spirochaetaceae bacterium]|jgi:outer membrane protein assembly factor BamB|nr:PQQ-binding-like beta-propeller repeat protein [Spirochaetaceae bacterium]